MSDFFPILILAAVAITSVAQKHRLRRNFKDACNRFDELHKAFYEVIESNKRLAIANKSMYETAKETQANYEQLLAEYRRAVLGTTTEVKE